MERLWGLWDYGMDEDTYLGDYHGLGWLWWWILLAVVIIVVPTIVGRETLDILFSLCSVALSRGISSLLLLLLRLLLLPNRFERSHTLWC